MRTTDERLRAAKRRAEEMKQQERRRRGKIAVLACSAACLAVIFALALAMPSIAARLSGAEYGTGLTLGVCVTVLCVRLRRHEREEESEGPRDA